MQRGGGGDNQINYAAQANGGNVAVSSTLDNRFLKENAIDGRRTYTRWDDPGQIWIAGNNAGGEFIVGTFDGTKQIRQISLFTVADIFTDNSEPDETTTFSAYGVTGYQLDYLSTGDVWVNLLTLANDFHRRKTHTVSVTAKAVRFSNLTSPDGYIRISEIEVFG